MGKRRVSAVLLSTKQVEELHKIQEEVRTKSPLGVAPTIHVIARGLMDKALSQLALEAR